MKGYNGMQQAATKLNTAVYEMGAESGTLMYVCMRVCTVPGVLPGS